MACKLYRVRQTYPNINHSAFPNNIPSSNNILTMEYYQYPSPQRLTNKDHKKPKTSTHYYKFNS